MNRSERKKVANKKRNDIYNRLCGAIQSKSTELELISLFLEYKGQEHLIMQAAGLLDLNVTRYYQNKGLL